MQKREKEKLNLLITASSLKPSNIPTLQIFSNISASCRLTWLCFFCGHWPVNLLLGKCGAGFRSPSTPKYWLRQKLFLLLQRYTAVQCCRPRKPSLTPHLSQEYTAGSSSRNVGSVKESKCWRRPPASGGSRMLASCLAGRFAEN